MIAQNIDNFNSIIQLFVANIQLLDISSTYKVVSARVLGKGSYCDCNVEPDK